MDNELEVIRDEMEQTRANLADKLGALENQVRETVSSATEAVSSTVEGVKDVVSTVSDTVESVTDTFNVYKQVEQHPWMAMGAALATGFVLAQVIGRSSQPAPAPAPVPSESPPQPAAEPQPAERREEPGLMDKLEGMLPDVSGVMNTLVGSLGGLAVGSLMGVIRELASTGLSPEWKGDVTKLIDQVTTQLGGKPLDSTRSNQLVGALGLDGQGQGDQSQAAPADAARQQGNGTHGVHGAGRQPVGGR